MPITIEERQKNIRLVAADAPSFGRYPRQTKELAFLDAACTYEFFPKFSIMPDIIWDMLARHLFDPEFTISPYIREVTESKQMRKKASTIHINWNRGIAAMAVQTWREHANRDQPVFKLRVKRSWLRR